MKWKLSLLMALVIGGLAGSWIKNLPGFVIIAYEKTTYEMRLWVAVCLILLILTLLALLLMFVHSLFSGAGRVKLWQSGRSWRKSRKRTIDGMLAFTEGRWKASEDAMINAAKTSDTKLINYLIAAQAAQHQNAEIRRDAYLRKAFQAEPAAKTAIGLTQAQLQLQHNQYEQALASLNELKQDNPNHPYVLKLLCRLYEKLQDWSQLANLLPALKKQRVFDEASLSAVEYRAVEGLLTQQSKAGKVEGLKDCWLNLPSSIRKSKKNIITYVYQLIHFAQMEDAEALLRPIIKKQPDTEVLRLYGQINAKDPAKQLSFLENWHKSQKSPLAESWLTLGKLAYYARLWGKARHFLERSLQTQPSAEAYLFMAKTLRNLDDIDHAADCYRLGLEFAATNGTHEETLSLPKGSEDLVSANLLPKFQKLES